MHPLSRAMGTTPGWTLAPSWHCLVIYFWDKWPSLAGNLLRIVITPRSTQPCIHPGSLNRVPASAGVKARKSPLPPGKVTLCDCDPTWHVISRSGVVKFTNCYTLFTLLYFLPLEKVAPCRFGPIKCEARSAHCTPKGVLRKNGAVLNRNLLGFLSNAMHGTGQI